MSHTFKDIEEKNAILQAEKQLLGFFKNENRN